MEAGGVGGGSSSMWLVHNQIPVFLILSWKDNCLISWLNSRASATAADVHKIPLQSTRDSTNHTKRNQQNLFFSPIPQALCCCEAVRDQRKVIRSLLPTARYRCTHDVPPRVCYGEHLSVSNTHVQERMLPFSHSNSLLCGFSLITGGFWSPIHRDQRGITVLMRVSWSLFCRLWEHIVKKEREERMGKITECVAATLCH